MPLSTDYPINLNEAVLVAAYGPRRTLFILFETQFLTRTICSATSWSFWLNPSEKQIPMDLLPDCIARFVTFFPKQHEKTFKRVQEEKKEWREICLGASKAHMLLISEDGSVVLRPTSHPHTPLKLLVWFAEIASSTVYFLIWDANGSPEQLEPYMSSVLRIINSKRICFLYTAEAMVKSSEEPDWDPVIRKRGERDSGEEEMEHKVEECCQHILTRQLFPLTLRFSSDPWQKGESSKGRSDGEGEDAVKDDDVRGAKNVENPYMVWQRRKEDLDDHGDEYVNDDDGETHDEESRGREARRGGGMELIVNSRFCDGWTTRRSSGRVEDEGGCGSGSGDEETAGPEEGEGEQHPSSSPPTKNNSRVALFAIALLRCIGEMLVGERAGPVVEMHLTGFFDWRDFPLFSFGDHLQAKRAPSISSFLTRPPSSSSSHRPTTTSSSSASSRGRSSASLVPKTVSPLPSSASSSSTSPLKPPTSLPHTRGASPVPLDYLEALQCSTNPQQMTERDLEWISAFFLGNPDSTSSTSRFCPSSAWPHRPMSPVVV